MFTERPTDRAKKQRGSWPNREWLCQRQEGQAQLAPREARQHRGCGSEDNAVRTPSSQRQGWEGEETHGLVGVGRRRQLQPVALKTYPEFLSALRWVDHAQLGADLADLANVAIGHAGSEWFGAVAHTGAQEAVGFGAVDPGEQMWIGRRVRRSGGGRTDDVFVDGTYDRHRLVGLGSGTKCGGSDERTRALEASERISAVGGVLGDACQCRWMQGLEQ